jgi:DNA ligase D-like protein (predicted polymerase)
MQIRKNTKAFKTIQEIITGCQERGDREQLIRLYITKAGHSIENRISVEGIQGEAGLFYEMNYQAVLNNLKSPNHQLHQSDDIPGIYFFHSSSNKVWDETPFEFDEAIRKVYGSLPDFPVVRKKEQVEKFILPTPGQKTEVTAAKKEKVVAKKVAVKVVDKGPKQPDYKLKHNIHFTDLDKIIFTQQKISKKDLLDYYNNISEYILPYLKDRPQSIRTYSNSGRNTEHTSSASLVENKVEIPAWFQTPPATKGKQQDDLLICNDKEHLLFFVELGCVEFKPRHSRTKSIECPDYILIDIDSPESTLGKAIEVALVAKDILSALQLPAFIKTDGMSRLHIYVPLDSKSSVDTSKDAAAYICKLIRIKVPQLVSLKGSDDDEYGKVSLDYMINDAGKTVVAPYSFVRASCTLATPLLWEEVKEGLHSEAFNHQTIFTRLKKIGDPFENLFKKKINADALLKRLEENYSFLV